MSARTASRAALIELRTERRVVEDGHRFLDEKRALLAHEVLDRLAGFRVRLERFGELERSAAESLAHAVSSAGFEAVQLAPEVDTIGGELVQQRRSFLGTQTVTDARIVSNRDGDARPDRPDRDADTVAGKCAHAHTAVADEALPLATELGNLLRLVREFQRTQRRVRALEKVVLPELRDEERRMEEALEEIDQEDAIHVRLAARAEKR